MAHNKIFFTKLVFKKIVVTIFFCIKKFVTKIFLQVVTKKLSQLFFVTEYFVTEIFFAKNKLHCPIV